MKKIYFLPIIILIYCINLYGQNSIPNPSFEQWVNNNQPVGWHGLFIDLFMQQFHTLSKTTDAQHGNFAARIETIEITYLGALPGLASISPIELDLMTGIKIKNAGTPFTAKATKVSGYFKYLQQNNDTAAVIVTFTKWDNQMNRRDTLFIGGFLVNQPVNSYMPFNISVSLGAQQPDSMNILLVSSASYYPQIGSALLVDNLSVTIDNTGIEETFTLLGDAYPNPTSDYVIFNVPSFGKNHIEVYDSAGKCVMKTTNDKQTFMLDFTTLNKGLYLVLINNNGTIYKSKIFKN